MHIITKRKGGRTDIGPISFSFSINPASLYANVNVGYNHFFFLRKYTARNAMTMNAITLPTADIAT